MGIDIEPRNAAGQFHGYSKGYHINKKKLLWYIIHYFKNEEIGYSPVYGMNGIVHWQRHFKNDNNKIGCEMCIDCQFFYNKPGKKFGEQIKWK